MKTLNIIPILILFCLVKQSYCYWEGQKCDGSRDPDPRIVGKVCDKVDNKKILGCSSRFLGEFYWYKERVCPGDQTCKSYHGDAWCN